MNGLNEIEISIELWSVTFTCWQNELDIVDMEKSARGVHTLDYDARTRDPS